MAREDHFLHRKERRAELGTNRRPFKIFTSATLATASDSNQQHRNRDRLDETILVISYPQIHSLTRRRAAEADTLLYFVITVIVNVIHSS